MMKINRRLSVSQIKVRNGYPLQQGDATGLIETKNLLGRGRKGTVGHLERPGGRQVIEIVDIGIATGGSKNARSPSGFVTGSCTPSCSASRRG